ELELFTFDDDVGPGLPLWLPRGAAIIDELEKLARETEFAAGYQRVRSTNLARESLYKKSGHLPYYADSMFPPMRLRESGKIGASITRAENSLEARGHKMFKMVEPKVEEAIYDLPGELSIMERVEGFRQSLSPEETVEFEAYAARRAFGDMCIKTSGEP